MCRHMVMYYARVCRSNSFYHRASGSCDDGGDDGGDSGGGNGGAWGGVHGGVAKGSDNREDFAGILLSLHRLLA